MSFPSTSNTDTIANLPSGLWGKARPVVGPTIGVDGPEPLAINWCAGGGSLPVRLFPAAAGTPALTSKQR